MGISKRLVFIANLVSPGYRVSDIGTDHGYVPIYLIKNKISPSVIAVDISEGSLSKAKENVKKYGYENQIQCRISDGLSEIQVNETDSIVISGMGGILIDRILRAKPEVVFSAKEIIVSPHRNVDLIYKYAEENKLAIVFDDEIMDKKKKYPIIKILIKRD